MSQRPCATTIGFFDGVHRGHRYLINQLKDEAMNRGLTSSVITFSVHPLSVILPDSHPRLITTFEEKKALLESTGVDSVCVLDFDKAMSQLTSENFIKDVLAKQLNVKLLIMGYDNKIGHDRESTFEDYRRFGAEAGIDVVRAKELEGDERVSSSAIRQALGRGDVLTANKLLGYAYSITGKVVGGHHIGRKLGFPTANVLPECADKFIPADGVYAVYVETDGNKYKGMMNIGVRPTVDNSHERTIEVNIIGYDGNLYDSDIKVIFAQRIREERKFESMDSLKQQMEADRLSCINVLS